MSLPLTRKLFRFYLETQRSDRVQKNRAKALKAVLTVAYLGVITPMALLGALVPGGLRSNWRNIGDRVGWKDLDVSSTDKEMYESMR